MLKSIQHGTEKIYFTIVRKAKLKNTYIQITHEGVLIKTNQTMSIKEIDALVERKASWISKKLALFSSIDTSKDSKDENTLYYMGKRYKREIITDKEAKNISISFKNYQFIIHTPSKYKAIDLHNAIEVFYKQKAKEKILTLSQKWAIKMAVTPTHIGFRYAKRRWGSCSSTNRISFNYHLIKLPISLIEYVVVHELAHIKHHNHSKDFWDFLGTHLPDYKDRENKIRVLESKIL